MDALNPLKQVITFQKVFFENAYEAMRQLQNQALEMNETLFKQMPLLSEENKNMIEKSVETGKQAQDNLKKALDDGFVRLEALFEVK